MTPGSPRTSLGIPRTRPFHPTDLQTASVCVKLQLPILNPLKPMYSRVQIQMGGQQNRPFPQREWIANEIRRERELR